MDIRDVYQNGVPTNSFRDYLCNKLRKSKRVVEEMLKEAYQQIIAQETETSPQTIENIRLEFDYQGEAEHGDWEHFFSSRTTMPIYNEFAPSDSAFIDWFNFTFLDERYDKFTRNRESIVEYVSKELEISLGYGVTTKRDRGLNFYQDSYVLGNNWGFVCIGGQRDTIMVSLNGEGCSAARCGWEMGLYDWGSQLDRFHITRVDIAHDCFDSEYTVDRAVQDYDAGLFGAGGRLPKIQQYGNWRVPQDKSGKTVYIGKRSSGKLCRIYEKGRQIGDPDSNWVRIECEWRSKNRYIPEDVLVFPGKYLAGAYPAFFGLNQIQDRIKTTEKKEQIDYQKLIDVTRHQSGKAIWYIVQKEGLEAAFNKLMKEGVPKRVANPDWQDAKTPIHAKTYGSING